MNDNLKLALSNLITCLMDYEPESINEATRVRIITDECNEMLVLLGGEEVVVI